MFTTDGIAALFSLDFAGETDSGRIPSTTSLPSYFSADDCNLRGIGSRNDFAKNQNWPDSIEIRPSKKFIGDVVVNDIPPKNRDIAMVFQNYALYPHMTVYQNMAFGLSMRHYPKKEIDEMSEKPRRFWDYLNTLTGSRRTFRADRGREWRSAALL
jgi:hypothetical protein